MGLLSREINYAAYVPAEDQACSWLFGGSPRSETWLSQAIRKPSLYSIQTSHVAGPVNQWLTSVTEAFPVAADRSEAAVPGDRAMQATCVQMQAEAGVAQQFVEIPLGKVVV